ncbi:MAG: GNAT family N-acetyltransferase [Filifactoraceae bacterium]
MNNISIVYPQSSELILEDFKNIIIELSDESDNFPFNSKDVDINDKVIKNYINYLISSINSTLCLCYNNNEIIGIGFLEGGKKERTFHLANLSIGVLKKYNDIGIGSKIVASLIEYAYECEYIGKIDIMVRIDNNSAISIYKKNGFTVEGKCRRGLFINNEFFDILYMGLIID